MADSGITTDSVESSPPGLMEQIKGLDNRFWIVNVMEMFERLAYYGVRAVVAIYMVLPLEQGGPQFTHVEKGTIFAWWAGIQSVLPMFTGGYADRYGHKRTISVAVILKIIGYVLMAIMMDFWGFFVGCMFLAAGTAIFKPGVQGTLAATLKESNASVGWGIFYQLVNVGGFLGPVLAGVLRIMDWQYVFYSCAIIVAINFLWLPFYKDPTEGMEISEEFADPWKVFVTSVLGLFKPRVFFFCIVFSGFWLMFNQVFDLLPNVIDDWVDSSGIIANIGAAFSHGWVTALLAITGGILYGGVCAAGVWLAMRPDHRAASEVPFPAYWVLAICFAGAIYACVAGMPMGQLLLILIGSSIAMSALAYFMRLSAGLLTKAVFAIAAIGSLINIRSTLDAQAPILIEMAEQGQQVNPEWMINLNPGLIVFTMIFFGYLTSFVRPLTSIIVGMVIATAGSVVAGTATAGFLCLVGILVFSVGEMFSSPKKMEYLATLSPKGQEGLFMGYANIPVAIGWIAGSIFAGNRYETSGDKVNLAKQHLIEQLGLSSDAVGALQKSEVLPLLSEKLNMTAMQTQQFLFETYNPHHIWIDIGLIGLGSIVAMVIYDRVLHYIDSKPSAA